MSADGAGRQPQGGRAHAAPLALAWFASCAAFLPAFAHPEVSRTALVLLPWLAWAGWPAARCSGFRARALPAAGLLLPLVALAVELDRSSGAPLGGTVHTALVGVALAGCAAAASTAAACAGPRRAALYGLAWMSTFLVLPLLFAVTRGAPASGWVETAMLASPLAWCLAHIAAEPAGLLHADAASLALVLILWLGCALPGRRGPAREVA